jgi:hypothetical protein
MPPVRGDGLAGARRVLEPEAAGRVGVVGGLGGQRGVLLLFLLARVPVERLVVLGDLVVALELDLAGGQLLDTAVAAAARSGLAVAVSVGLRLGQQRDQRAGQRVDLVGGQHGAVDQVGLVLGHQPLEAEHQRVVAAPLDRGLLAPRVDLGQCVLERAAARRALGQRGRGILALMDERLVRELLGTSKIVRRERRSF